MRRVVVTGMGIVSSIGANAQEVLATLHEARSGVVSAEDYAELGFRSQVHGAPTVKPRGNRRPPRDALSWRRHRLGHVAMDQAIADAGLERKGNFERAHRPDRRFRRPFDPRAGRGRRHDAQQGPEAGRSVRRAEGDVLDRFGDLVDLVQDQGHQLFDLFGLLDVQPLHRQCRRTDPVGQAGHGFRRRLRGAGLDAVGAVRRDGRDVVRATTTARRSPRAPTTRTATASSSPAAPASWCSRNSSMRGRAARKSTPNSSATARLRRRRHGRAVGRRRGALHAHGDREGEGADRLHQSARDLDAGRRSQGNRGDPRSVRRRRQMPADLRDEVADRPFAGRDRRARSDLLAADAEERLHLRERQYRGTRSRPSPTCRSCASAATTPSSAPCCRTRSASAAPTPRSSSNISTREPGADHERANDTRPHARPPRPDHGRRQSHSIAWGIAKTLAEHGAELAFTYQGDALGKRVAPLAAQLGSDFVLRATSRTSPPSTRSSRTRESAGARSISSSTPSGFPTSASSRAATPTRRAKTFHARW